MISYIELHQLGFSLIPIAPRQKIPDVSVLPKVYNKDLKKQQSSWKQYMEVPADAAQLDKWFENTNRNIGLVLGAISGFVCIDTDNEAAEKWVAENMPSTPMMTTTARGYHRFYRYPYHLEVPAFIRLEGLSIEIRRDGQYVLGPGSTHPSGVLYAETQPWPSDISDVPELPELVLQYQFAVAERPIDTSERPEHVAHTNSGLEYLTVNDTLTSFEVPEVIPQSERHHTLFKLMRSLKSKGSSLEDALRTVHEVNAKNCHPPLDRPEVTKTLTRAYHQPDQPGHAPIEVREDEDEMDMIEEVEEDLALEEDEVDENKLRIAEARRILKAHSEEQKEVKRKLKAEAQKEKEVKD